MELNKKDESRDIRKASISITTIFAVSCLLLISGCAGMMKNGADTGGVVLTSPTVQVDEGRLRPGLSVVYFHGFWRHLNQMPSEKRAKKKGFAGEPIPYLNHRFGEGMVFKSGRSKGVGLYLNGFIEFEKPGKYVFQARTNDGFRLLIDGEEIIEDPNVHSDRFSEKTQVSVGRAGWYPLYIQYFQRKGTSTIELYWTKPGDADKSIVPAEAYAHLP